MKKKCYYNTLKHFKTLSQLGLFSFLLLLSFLFTSSVKAESAVYIDSYYLVDDTSKYSENGTERVFQFEIPDTCDNSMLMAISNERFDPVTGVKYNNVDFTKIWDVKSSDANNNRVYTLMSPSVGNNYLKYYSGGHSPFSLVLFCNVNQTTPFYYQDYFKINFASDSYWMGIESVPDSENLSEHFLLYLGNGDAQITPSPLNIYPFMTTLYSYKWDDFQMLSYNNNISYPVGTMSIRNTSYNFYDYNQHQLHTFLNEALPPPTPTCAENYVLVDGICYYSPQQEQKCADGYTEVDGICLYNGILPDCANGYTEVYNADWGGLICLKTELLPTGANNCDPITETPVYGLNGWECFLNAETTKQPKDPDQNNFGWNTYEMACSAEKWNTPDPVFGIEWLNATTSVPALNFSYLFCSLKKFSLDMASYPLEYIRVQATKLKGRAQTIFPFNILNNFLKSFQKAEMRVGLFEIKTAHATSTFDFMEMPENGDGFNIKLGKIGDNDEMTFKLFNKTDIENTLGSDLVNFMRNFFNLALYFLFFIYIFQRIKNFDL